MLISIIIPAYNLESQITETLISLVNQTNNDFEIIVIDDGSTDNTYNVALSVLKDCSFCNFSVLTQKNCGVSQARNVGISKSKGEYIFFLDGDDYVSKDLVQTIKTHVDKTDEKLDVICWGYSKVNSDGVETLNYFKRYADETIVIKGIEVIEKIALEKSLSIAVGSAVYSKELLKKHGISYTVGCKSGEDQEFSIKVLAKSDNVLFINKTLSYYVSRKNSISNSYNVNKFDAVHAMESISKYLLAQGEEYSSLSHNFGNDKLIESYLVNYSSCLQNMDNKNTSQLNNEIERKYPGLNKKVLKMMRSNNFHDKQLIMKIILFQIHPKLFNFILNSNIRKKLKFRKL
ncbi:putative glycosyltransferase EpsJ [Jeotgalibaca dankookensis]|uniref:Putative glycosyltransferase EpsJ n=1 Tax=Jeotgalibaca dankookensis TaxID=708126 RepID=A0A1S6IM60_9LACT|nr:glycosyltransferase family A protein [Jeotgalibaca dankookensis]AQS52643.1 putative glycosyltransferase EpsJ [Jeotgalibaca dankookensis]